jgi:dTDP-4-dehydrorhamnose 3,5-epimerase|tara:strand:+ start:204 stop:734 length:531 start_codon:yes stop_codon:yes gene_type:complete
MIIKTKFKNLFIINGKKFSDKRGHFRELLKENKTNNKFPFIVASFSKKNVIRGLHIQLKKSQGKYISVLKGKIFDVAVDLRKKSNTYGKYFGCILSEKNSKSIYIPPGFAHGFCALDKENYIIYSCTQYRNTNSEVGIKYNDKDLKINWPIKKPTISKKDNSNYSFLEFNKKFNNV